jgi:dihydrofolate reductase
MHDLITMEEVMRKIIESTLVSLDGVIGDPHLWAMNYFDNEAQEDALELLLASDAMLMGRRTYEIFAVVWPARTGDYADRMNSLPKFVASRTLQEPLEWNSTLLKGKVVEEVQNLKQQAGKDILIYGSGELVNTLMRHNLIDVYRVMLYPLTLGIGKRYFRNGDSL